MKLMIILSVVAFSLAKEFDMKLEENGNIFIEHVKVDVAGKTEEIKVPKHGNVEALDMLNDFNVGYCAMKVIAEKACYISVISEEQTPKQMERSMEVSHAKFSTDSYMVQKDKFIRLYELTSSEVGAKIAAHCTGYKMIFVVKYKKDKDVLNIAKSHASRMKRANGKGFREFTACKERAKHILNNCIETKIAITCRVLFNQGQTCAYKITCNHRPRGWHCNGVHRYNLITCCDYTCLP